MRSMEEAGVENDLVAPIFHCAFASRPAFKCFFFLGAFTITFRNVSGLGQRMTLWA